MIPGDMMHRAIFKVACLFLALPVASQATAQPAPRASSAKPSSSDSSQMLQEIIVTAELRKEPLQDVPVSVQVLGQKQLDAQGVRSMDDVARLTPGVSFQRNGGSLNDYNGEESDIAIRGIQSSAGAQTTGIYLDDVPIQGRHMQFGTLNAYPALFDLARVEVLRGPQGTLFGAGSEGGTVRFITAQPSLHSFSAYTLAEGADTDGGDPSYQMGAAAGGPISEGTLGYRVSASYRRDGGWVDRVDFLNGDTVEKNSNWQDTYVLQGALTYAPTANLTITPSIYFQDLYLNDTPDTWSTLSDAPAGVFRNGNLVNNKSSDPWVLPSMRIEWDDLWGGAAKLTANTAYFSRNQRARVDYTEFNRIIYTGNPYPPPGHVAPAYFTDSQHNVVQELRLQSTAPDSRLDWLVGFFYEHQRENTTQTVYDPTLREDVLSEAGYDIGPLVDGVYSYLQSPFLAIDTQYALFGQVDYRLIGGLKLTAGVRAEDAKFDGQAHYEYPINVLGPPVTSSSSSSERPVTPRLGLSYQPRSSILLYTSAAKGFRIGGINAPLPGACDPELSALGHPDGAPPRYGSDSVWSYELGAKTMLWQRRLVIDASVYRIDWNGIQQNIYLPLCGFEYTANLGRAESRGGDLDIRALVTKSLTLQVSAGYTDAFYRQTISGTTANVISSGDHLPANPWLVAASANYEIQAFGAVKPYLRVDWQMAAAQRSPTQVQDPADISYDANLPLQPATRWLSARAGMTVRGLDLSIFGQNLTNSRPLLYRSHDLVSSPLYYDYTWRPRTIGLTVTYHYR